MPKSMILKPRLSEKAYALSEHGNTYVFDVPAKVNRQMVADAVASQYDVSVVSVKMAKTAPKPMRSYKKRGRSLAAQKPGIRKMYVKLKDNDHLPIFAYLEDDSEAKK